MAHALAREPANPASTRPHPFACSPADPKTKAFLVPNRPKDTRRIVDEGALVQDTNAPGAHIENAAEWIQNRSKVRAVEADGDRIDGEVPAQKIFGYRSWADLR